MESTKQIRSIRSIRGQKNKRLTEREAWLTFKMGVSGVSSVSGVSGVSFRFWTKKTPVFGPNRNKTSVSSVSSASGFQVQDTHNASYFTNMTWIGLNLSGWNVTRLFHLRCFEL